MYKNNVKLVSEYNAVFGFGGWHHYHTHIWVEPPPPPGGEVPSNVDLVMSKL